MNRRLAQLRLPEIDRISPSSILIQPVGSIEQHGPHLPYHTDLVIAHATAEAVVDSHGEALDLWLLPPLIYTKSNEHAWAPGTIWLSASTLLAVLDDLGRSLTTLSSRKLVFINGHGGNSSLLNVACRDLRLAHGLQTYLVHPMVPPDQGGVSSDSEQGMGIHGGFLETSMMMFLEPDQVSAQLPPANLPDVAGPSVGFGGPVTFGWSADDFGSAGHIGDPTGSSAEIGRRVFEQAVSSFAEALQEISTLEL